METANHDYESFTELALKFAHDFFDPKDDTFSHGLVYSDEGLSVLTFAGDVSPTQKAMTMRSAAAQPDTKYVAIIFETFAVTSESPEQHAKNIRKYGPAYADWPEDLRRENLIVSLDSHDPDEETLVYRANILPGRELTKFECSEGVAHGRLVGFFPKTSVSKITW